MIERLFDEKINYHDDFFDFDPWGFLGKTDFSWLGDHAWSHDYHNFQKFKFLGITIGRAIFSFFKKSWKRSENGPKIEKIGGKMKKGIKNLTLERN